MLPGSLVERGGVDLAAHRAPHVGDLLGAFVEQQHHQPCLRVVPGDRGGELLDEDGLAGLGRCDDQPALALADRREQVDDPSGEPGRRVFEAEPLVRMQGRQITEVAAAPQRVGRTSVDARHVGQGTPAVAQPFDGVALAQAEPADQGGCDLDVVGGGQAGGGAQMPLPVAVDVEDTGDELGLGLLPDRGVFERGGHGGRSFRGHKALRHAREGGESARGRGGVRAPPAVGKQDLGHGGTAVHEISAEEPAPRPGSAGATANWERNRTGAPKRGRTQVLWRSLPPTSPSWRGVLCFHSLNTGAAPAVPVSFLPWSGPQCHGSVPDVPRP